MVSLSNNRAPTRQTRQTDYPVSFGGIRFEGTEGDS